MKSRKTPLRAPIPGYGSMEARDSDIRFAAHAMKRPMLLARLIAQHSLDALSECGDAPGNNCRQNDATSQNHYHFGAAVSTIEIETKQPLYPIHVESSNSEVGL
jgi:hypothetical protein